MRDVQSVTPAGSGSPSGFWVHVLSSPLAHSTHCCVCPCWHPVSLVVQWVDVTRLEKNATLLFPESIRVDTRDQELFFSMFLNIGETFKLMEQLANLAMRQLLDSEGFLEDKVLPRPARPHRNISALKRCAAPWGGRDLPSLPFTGSPQEESPGKGWLQIVTGGEQEICRGTIQKYLLLPVENPFSEPGEAECSCAGDWCSVMVASICLCSSEQFHVP